MRLRRRSCRVSAGWGDPIDWKPAKVLQSRPAAEGVRCTRTYKQSYLLTRKAVLRLDDPHCTEYVKLLSAVATAAARHRHRAAGGLQGPRPVCTGALQHSSAYARHGAACPLADLSLCIQHEAWTVRRQIRVGDSKPGFYAIASPPDPNNHGVVELLVKAVPDSTAQLLADSKDGETHLPHFMILALCECSSLDIPISHRRRSMRMLSSA